MIAVFTVTGLSFVVLRRGKTRGEIPAIRIFYRWAERRVPPTYI
jgi:hypothetical protein